MSDTILVWEDGELVEKPNDFIAPIDEPTGLVPSAVSKAQAKLALLEAGLLDTVETALASMEGVEGQRARIEWNDRTEFHRDHEFIGLLAASIGLSDEQIDALFERASQL